MTHAIVLVFGVCLIVLIWALLHVLEQKAKLQGRLEAALHCLDQLERERRRSFGQPRSRLLSSPVKFHGGRADAKGP